MHQRFPVYARPLPFVLGGATFLVGLQLALNWAWEWSLQTGNLFLQISVPTRLVVFEGVKLFFWILSAIGLLVFVVFGAAGRKAARRAHEEGGNPLWVPRFRFHPFTFALGLFLTYFGLTFLFNASITPDDTPSGFVIFVYLNYAGIVHRSVITILALMILIVGVTATLFLAFKPGLGFPQTKPAPEPTPPPAAAPTPMIQPAPTRAPAPVARTPPPRNAPPPRAATARPRAAATSAAGRRPRAPSTSRSS